MLYLSQLLGRPIRDLEDERVATVKDVIVRLGSDDHPPVSGLVARYRRRDFFLSRWRVTGADVSLQGLWRRLAPPGFVGTRKPVEVLDWADVGYLATDAATVQLKSSSDKLARLHPVEIARLAEALSYHHGSEVVESLDDETAAETLEEMPAERQARILGDMDEARAADILEWMSPDEAADVLGDLPEEKAEELFGLMEDEEQADVAELNNSSA